MSASVPTVASPFSHLARNAPPVVAGKASDDDDKKKKDEEEAKRAEDKKKEDEEAKKAEDKKKEDEEAAAKKKADDKKKEEDAKKADDDDGDTNDDKDPDARAARARERGRIRAIVTSDAGKLNPVGAMHLATGTSMSRSQAIETLHAMGAPAAAAEPARLTDTLRDRMANVRNPDVGPDGAQPPANAGTAKATADAIIAAGKKRRGETT